MYIAEAVGLAESADDDMRPREDNTARGSSRGQTVVNGNSIDGTRISDAKWPSPPQLPDLCFAIASADSPVTEPGDETAALFRET